MSIPADKIYLHRGIIATITLQYHISMTYVYCSHDMHILSWNMQISWYMQILCNKFDIVMIVKILTWCVNKCNCDTYYPCSSHNWLLLNTSSSSVQKSNNYPKISEVIMEVKLYHHHHVLNIHWDPFFNTQSGIIWFDRC